jgi:PRTRC genetic system ThiF family protein
MDFYTFDPRQMVRQIVVVGLGGTGSHVARNLARLLYHRQRNRQFIPELMFVDPDIIEQSNIGCQLFAPAELNQPKAQVLARRYNFAFGLSISAVCEPLDAQKHIPHGAIVCGCVDNHHARREIAKASRCTWIDAGNEFDFGQVIIGNTGDWQTVVAGLDRACDGKSTVLPHAGLLFASLLEPEPEPSQPEPNLSCAERVAQGDQHIYINDFIGNLVTQYVYKLLNRDPITTFATFVSLDPSVTVRSVPITRENLEVYQ